MTDPGEKLIAELAASGTVPHILATHVADARGRCAACSLDDRRRPAWPCGLLRLAWAAVGPDRPTP